MPKMITKPLTIRLRGLVANIFPEDDAYRAWLAEQYDVASTLDLTEAQANHAISELIGHARREIGGGSAPKGRRYAVSGAAGRITQKQADYIAGLEDRLGWSADRSRLVGFIRRQLRLDDKVYVLVPSLSVADASKVIVGLEKLSEEGCDQGRVADALAAI